MKVVLAFSLAFLAVVYGTASFQGLFSSVNQLTLTSSAKNTADGWTIVGLVADSTYKGDNTGNDLKVTFNVTYTGTLAQNVAAVAVITFSGQTPWTSASGATCTDSLAEGASPIFFDASRSTIMYEASLSPLFTGTESVTGTVQLQFPPNTNVGSPATFTFAVTSPYVPATGITPTALSFSIASSFDATDDVAANITIGNTIAAPYSVTLFFTGADPSGVVWFTTCTILDTVVATGTQVGGTCGSDANRWTNLSPAVGSWCGNGFVGSVVTVSYPKNTQLTLKSVTISKTGGSNSFSGSSGVFGGSFSITAGATDVTPPQCTAAAFVPPLDVATANTPLTNGVGASCTDEMGGSGLYTGGIFVRAVSGSIVYDYAASGTFPVQTISVPLHYDGTVSILGVWAMDNDGNAVVYGSCAPGSAASVCGGSGGSSGSSAVVASISLVIALILAVLAL